MGGMQGREGDVVGDDTSCFFYDCASVDVPITLDYNEISIC